MQKNKKNEIEFENKIAKNYNAWYYSTHIEKQHTQQFIDFIKRHIKDNNNVLDLGCGPASLWNGFSKLDKIHLTGVDISPKMIKEAKKLYPKKKFIIADSEKLPFKDETFDVVICSSMLHHLSRTEKTLKEIKRTLKPYGILIGREPQKDQFIKETNTWISGAAMMIVHLFKQKKLAEIHSEPAMHKFHDEFQLRKYFDILNGYFVVKDIKSKFPFSSLFTKLKHTFTAKYILKTDELLANFKGNQFFYLAQKDGYEKKEILSYIRQYLNSLESSKNPPLKFIKRLILLTIIAGFLPKND